VRPRAKVTTESLYEVVYEKSIGTKMNDLDLRLEVVLRSCQPLRDIRRSKFRKPLEIEDWFQNTTNWRWHMDYRRCCEAARLAILATAWLLVIYLHTFGMHSRSGTE